MINSSSGTGQDATGKLILVSRPQTMFDEGVMNRMIQLFKYLRLIPVFCKHYTLLSQVNEWEPRNKFKTKRTPSGEVITLLLVYLTSIFG